MSEMQSPMRIPRSHLDEQLRRKERETSRGGANSVHDYSIRLTRRKDSHTWSRSCCTSTGCQKRLSRLSVPSSHSPRQERLCLLPVRPRTGIEPESAWSLPVSGRMTSVLTARLPEGKISQNPSGAIGT